MRMYKIDIISDGSHNYLMANHKKEATSKACFLSKTTANNIVVTHVKKEQKSKKKAKSLYCEVAL